MTGILGVLAEDLEGILVNSSLGGKLGTILPYLSFRFHALYSLHSSISLLVKLSSLLSVSLSLSFLSSTCSATFLFRQLEDVIAKMTKENASVL